MSLAPLGNDSLVAVTFGTVAVFAQALQVAAVVEVLTHRPRYNVVHHVRGLHYALPLALGAQGMLCTERTAEPRPPVRVVRVGRSLTLVCTIALVYPALSIPSESHIAKNTVVYIPTYAAISNQKSQCALNPV